ncbi:MAG: DEAD/DEAH box helicase [Rhodobacter sp.]|nr:DEAD/DEAH box helicase [Paracoccaceae bacterium]MCC0079057.1 DEAD/DEAH box helicase [Rhodobacter sp.]
MTSALPPLPAPLATALAEQGYDTLTPVQEAVLDPALATQDLLVSAQTGSGKTVAFGLALASGLLMEGDQMPPPDTPRALIIAPTRELALQVRREFEWLYGPAGAVLASCVGGMDIRTERRALERGAHIVVGTPGRLRDHIERSTIDLGTVRAVVLDEADEMLDLGFREDLEFILQTLPEDRRTLLFSATVSREIERLAQTYQRDAQRVATAAAREQHGDIAYRAMVVAAEDAEHAIVNTLRFYEARNALVFCKTRAAVNHLTARFLNRGFPVVPLSGELAQDERARALQAMRDGRARVCVATDVAARGIDLPGLELVIHADLPTNKETLLHRSGRTGRAGKKGVSVLVVPTSAQRKAERLLKMAGVDAEWGPAPTAAEVSARDAERLLTDSALTTPEAPDEAETIAMLAERFTARELAAAVSRFYFAARSAPEDVVPVSAEGPKPRPRADFERSFWVRLGVGRNERAEPRWLLPMLCRAGQLTKADIGAIRIFDDYTLAQLHDDCADRFFNALGDDMALEQGIPVARAEAPAESERPAPRPRRDEGERPYRPRREDGDRPARSPRTENDARPPRAPRARDESRPHAPRDRTPPGEDRPRPPRHEASIDRPKRDYRPREETAERPKRADRPRDEGADRPKPAYRPREERSERPYSARESRPKGDAPAGKRPYTPRGDDTTRPPRPAKRGDDGPAPRKSAKFSAERPARDEKPAKPARPRIDPEAARNPSARLAPPKGKKAPARKPRPTGGDQRPTRPKR